MTLTTISAAEFAKRHQEGESLDLLDVRTPAEFRERHVAFARNVPLDALDPAKVMKGRKTAADSPLYVICQSGGRSQKACDRLQQAGFQNVINVAGGTQACAQTALPLVHGKKAVSLERQVRIAAGGLVLAGVALSILVHPALVGLSAFVGAGLVFAGVTDTCGMAMLLAKMPWNRCGGSACAAT